MGKFTNKSNPQNDVTEPVSQSELTGVCTRSKSKALKRRQDDDNKENENDEQQQLSVGDNSLESRDRESTPCSSLLRDGNIIGTPGAATKPASKIHLARKRGIIIPAAQELDEFFAPWEQRKQKLFMEKYNFDVVNDVPLSGRYEWTLVKP